jgi:hypothetical protein
MDPNIPVQPVQNEIQAVQPTSQPSIPKSKLPYLKKDIIWAIVLLVLYMFVNGIFYGLFLIFPQTVKFLPAISGFYNQAVGSLPAIFPFSPMVLASFTAIFTSFSMINNILFTIFAFLSLRKKEPSKAMSFILTIGRVFSLYKIIETLIVDIFNFRMYSVLSPMLLLLLLSQMFELAVYVLQYYIFTLWGEKLDFKVQWKLILLEFAGMILQPLITWFLVLSML